MNANSVYKIPDGKLVKISMNFSGEKIEKIRVFGDFFLYPENGIEKIEKNLVGKKIDEKTLTQEIDRPVKENQLELFGPTSDGLSKAILLAKESAQNAGV
ncbi:MAG: hypothetical protein HYW50_04165 [Candidatus Diapherotrites archaeon]|nr:hypothetical protein [Candidatus Diapherotrites archaeon]